MILGASKLIILKAHWSIEFVLPNWVNRLQSMHLYYIIYFQLDTSFSISTGTHLIIPWLANHQNVIDKNMGLLTIQLLSPGFLPLLSTWVPSHLAAWASNWSLDHRLRWHLSHWYFSTDFKLGLPLFRPLPVHLEFAPRVSLNVVNQWDILV